MKIVTIPFINQMYEIIEEYARKKGLEPEVIMKTWILERAEQEFKSDTVNTDLSSFPFKAGAMLIKSASATGMLVCDLLSMSVKR